MENDIADCVAAGGTFLDRELPGWALEIDPETLNEESPTRSVLGQYFGSQFVGEINLFGSGPGAKKRATEMGLHAMSAFGQIHKTPEMVAEFSALTAAWKPEIEKRRAAALEEEPLLLEAA